MSARRRLRTRYDPPVEPRGIETPLATPDASVPTAVRGDARPRPAVVDLPKRKRGKFTGEVIPTQDVEPLADVAEAVRARVPIATRVEHLPATPVELGTEVETEAGTVTEAETAIGAPPRHRVAGFFLMFGLALTAFATGVLLFNNLVMPRLIHGIGQVEVPDVRNLTLDQAELALRAAGLQLSREGERFDPGVPRGFVLAQEPAPGTAVRGRKRVSVVVSLGEEYSSVPELFGESQRTAEQLIRSAGLQLGAVTRAPSDQVGEGLVVGSDPGPENVLPQGSTVSLLVSIGAGEDSYVMPDLLGREVAGVRRQLEAYGFRVVSPPGAGSLGTIISQRPAAGSRITRATEIVLQATGRMIR